jgi:hypothetical protein
MTDDLFADAPPDPGLEFIQANGRTYRLVPRTIDGRQCLAITWAGPGATHGVVGGYHRDDAAAMAAVEQIEAARAARGKT